LHIIDTTASILTKFCTVIKDHQTPFVGDPVTRTTYPRWRTAAILKKDKSYLHNGMIDRRKISQGDANWPSPPYGPLKFRTFKKSKMTDGCHFEYRKTAISRQRYDRSPRNLAWYICENWYT